jgi:UDP-3-O-[3-hydroxymyristoyl] glucosamine N-acyltransferase LpxD
VSSQECENSVIVTSKTRTTCSVIISNNPRLDFIRALNWLYDNDYLPTHKKGVIHNSAKIHPTATIDDSVTIGSNSLIGPNSCILNGAQIGSNVVIGANSIVGSDGFGYEKDKYGSPIMFPHIGIVCIEDNVTIGNLCSISRGVIDRTTISSNVKIDDQVYIAHNTIVGKNSMLMSGVRVNGSVRIGRNCWIGTGAMIREYISLYDDVLVGMGSVVVKDVDKESVVMGNPAKNRKKICVE